MIFTEEWFTALQESGEFDDYAGRPAALAKLSYEEGFKAATIKALDEIRKGNTTWDTICALKDGIVFHD